MQAKDIKIVTSVLGNDVFEDLKKYEIFKPETKTVVDPEEIRVALEIVPRTILSYLFANLKHKESGEVIDLDLPFAPGVELHINKKGPDNYHGHVIKEGKILNDFQHRSLPSIGLILLTCLELYDMSLLEEIKQEVKPETHDKIEKLQDIIDERLTMHRLVQDVVDRRISEREAINQIIKEKLHSHILTINQKPEKEEDLMEDTKKSKLREFMEYRENKRQEPVEMGKNEISCPDCKTNLYKSENKNKIKLCLCYGEYRNKEIKFTKSADGKVKLKFPKAFDIDNIEMLLEALNNK